MAERSVSIEMTSEEVLLNSAAGLIATIAVNHPEIVDHLDREQAEAFTHAALVFLQHGDTWSAYLLKMQKVCHGANTMEGC